MNRHNFDQQYDDHFQTRRSEKYRHPQGQFSDDFTNENHYGRGYQRDYYRNNARHNSNAYDRGDDNRYRSPRNYGNMGNYGGAQGYGLASGHGSPYNDYDDYRGSRGASRTGSYTKYDSFNSNQQDNRDRDWNSDHDRIDWNSSSGNRSWENNSRNTGWDRDRNRSNPNRNFGQQSNRYQDYSTNRNQQGAMQRYTDDDIRLEDNDYRIDNYNRARWNNPVTRGDYSSNDGNYGSLDPFRAEGRLDRKPYGLSGYYGGGYGLDV